MITSSEPQPRPVAVLRRDRLLRRAGIVLLVLFVGAGASGLLGTRTAEVSGQGGGHELTVTYPSVTRSGHAVRLEVEVRRRGGFDGPVAVRLGSAYFDLFDENAFDPTPTSHTSDGEHEVMLFDPPPGDTLVVSVDTRVEPARQRGARGSAAVLDDAGRPVVDVQFRTRLLP